MKKELQVTEKEMNMTAREMRESFKKPEYKPARTIAFLDRTKPEEEKTVDNFIAGCTPFVIIFSQLMDKHENIITENSFVDFALTMFNIKAVERSFEMTSERKAYLRWRAESAYKGFVTELYATTLLLETIPNILISTNVKADLKEGVDFLVSVLGSDITHRFHVTSIEGEKRISYKEKKIAGRYFGKDKFLVYNNHCDDDKSYRINSFPFFRKKYLLDTFEASINDKSKGFKNNDPDFIDRCVRHGGEWKILKENEINPSYEGEVQEIKKILSNKA